MAALPSGRGVTDRRQEQRVSDIAARLTAVKLMVRGMGDAMPTLAKELRREACESIDDVIRDLGAIVR